MNAAKTQNSLEIPSKAESINTVERLIDDLRTEFDIHEDVYGNMLVAVTEAVNNAIIIKSCAFIFNCKRNFILRYSIAY